MTNEELEQEISKNIQLVFDNEKSFIKSFLSMWADANVEKFFMGSGCHSVSYFDGRHGPGVRYIKNNDFNAWKQSLNKDDSNE